jgi:uncharacterized membrane protein (GlpM family)
MDLVILIIKAAFAGAIVLGISMIAERVSPRAAGIISGAPLGALISYYFLGIEQGIEFVIESIPHAVAGMSGVLVFISLYHAVSSRIERYNLLLSTLAGVLGFFCFALILQNITFSIVEGLVVAVTAALLAGFLLRRAVDIRVVAPVRMTMQLLSLRAGFAAALVVSVVGLAKILGPVWAGILMGFPMTLLPTLLIVHVTYSKEHVYAMLRGFPLGIGSVLCYLLTVPISFPALGVNFGTMASLAVALGYLAVLSMLFKWRRRNT